MEEFARNVTEKKDGVSKTFHLNNCGNSVDNIGLSIKDAIENFGAGFDDVKSEFQSSEPWKQIMNEQFFGCFNAPIATVFSCCCGSCQNANTLASVDGSNSWCVNCCCTGCCLGCDRTDLINKIGMDTATGGWSASGNCLINCGLRCCCFCCAATQEARAVNQFVKAHRNTSDGVLPSAPVMF